MYLITERLIQIVIEQTCLNNDYLFILCILWAQNMQLL